MRIRAPSDGAVGEILTPRKDSVASVVIANAKIEMGKWRIKRLNNPFAISVNRRCWIVEFRIDESNATIGKNRIDKHPGCRKPRYDLQALVRINQRIIDFASCRVRRQLID